jgi:hypothetical protein
MSNKVRRDSLLVQSVLALDAHLSELERVGTKIQSTDMASDFDVDYVQKLMNRFAECGQGVSDEVANLSARLRKPGRERKPSRRQCRLRRTSFLRVVENRTKNWISFA